MARSKKVKVRRTWGSFKPTTRVKQSKKVYRRELAKAIRDRFIDI